jgi:phosphatidylglycerol:prolipoprotein diacylglycerol transferase
MKSVLLRLFGINIYGYGTMIAIGICAALLLLNYRARKRQYDEDSVLNMSMLAIILGIMGGKLLYILTDIKAIIADVSILAEVGSGFVIYGAIIGGVLGVFIYSKRKGWDVLRIFDLVIPAVPLAQGFGRIGCFLAGCCYGSPTNLTIGVQFPEDSLYAPSGIHLHPTQIYSSIFDFALAFFLLWYDKKERKKGRLFSMYVIIYSVGRFFVEFLRDDPRGSVGIFSTSQFISIFTVIIGIVLFNIHRIKKNESTDVISTLLEAGEEKNESVDQM